MKSNIIDKLIEKTCFLNGITLRGLQKSRDNLHVKIRYCLIYILQENQVPIRIIKEKLGYSQRTNLYINDVIETGINYDSQYKFWFSMINRILKTINKKHTI